RIRAGASVEQVADAAGVPEQKIERFAYPVLLERFRTAENAQRAHPVRRDGPDNRTLGDVVAHTFGLRGQAYEGARWDSWKGEDGRWVVALGWRAGRSENRAHWTFQPGAHGGTVTALDEHASDLVEGLPARPLRTVGAVVDMHPEEGAPPPAPTPVEQWRAAASDSYRERMPHAPEQARPAPDRGGARTPEPWRPAPAQRQAETTETRPADPQPVEARLGEQRAGAYRGAEGRPERENGHRATAEWAPPARGGSVDRQESVVPAQARPEPAHASAPPEPARPLPTLPEPAPAVPPAVESPSVETPPWDRGRLPEEAPPSEAPAPVDAPPSTVPAPPEPEAVADPVAAPEPAAPEAAAPEAPAPEAPAPVAAALEVTAPDGTAAAAPEPTAPEITAPEITAPEITGEAAAPEERAAETPTPQEPAAQEPAAEEPTASSAAQEPATDAPAAETPAANRRTRKGKPVMPSWDEVLLGVRGPR
ncbi:MAG: hypothetical protein QOK35_1862, partial [Pseudonocardiales bacterium]|nr:hypothetical protein [Pseudonocardiales bacterium]